MEASYEPKQLLKTFLRDISQKNNVITVLDQYLKEVPPLVKLQKKDEIPFSSDRKYSACIYDGISLVLGAPEVLLEKSSLSYKQVEEYAQESFRVVTFGTVSGAIKSYDTLRGHFMPLAVIAIDDPIRVETQETLAELAKNNIEYRIISGDSVDTVTAVARKINKNIPVQAVSGLDLDTMSPAEFEQAVLTHNVFARIKPQQKQIIIHTLKKNKLFTVMIGDGVNDVLALREADLGIAMNGGSAMARDVADVVLANNSFATLPLILYEGRRIIANIQTIANIYLIKNISSILTILILGFIGLRFPFDPRHVEIASVLVIGLPSFVLAFEKHTFQVSDKGFISRLLIFSSAVAFVNALIFSAIYIYFDLVSEKLFYSRTMLLIAVIFAGVNNLFLIYQQHYSLPQITERKIFVGLIVGIYMLFFTILAVPFVRSFFNISTVTPIDVVITFGLTTIGALALIPITRRFRHEL